MSVTHPAKFTDSILSVIQEYLEPGWRVLDPFAGTGRVHRLSECLFLPGLETWGVELEPEWARMHPRTVQGNALALPFRTGSFDAVCTSPTYANRLADHHNARDDSRRLTYKHALGRDPHPDSSCTLQWGAAYRLFHRRAWSRVFDVLKPGGRFVLNVSDHIRAGEPQRVPEWHLATCRLYGFALVDDREVETPRMRFGENADARIDHERVLVFDR